MNLPICTVRDIRNVSVADLFNLSCTESLPIFLYHAVPYKYILIVNTPATLTCEYTSLISNFKHTILIKKNVLNIEQYMQMAELVNSPSVINYMRGW